ncbi:MAG: roadblock/LC7 domain-containing protein [Brachymonas sp.]|nr:roadblock/LC7 domain-containing protein [Brachymonas sp.]
MSLPDHVKAAAAREANLLLQEVDGLSAVVIATIDGFDVAHAAKGDIEASRIAAMTSSVSAIGEAVSHEASLGKYRSIAIDTENGLAILQAVPRKDVPLVLNLIANGKSMMAQVMYRAKQSAKTLEEA